MYTVYHLPEMEKVGCTNNFERRMKEQGFEPLDEYRKSVHSNIEEASIAEEALREFYGYKQDSPQTYAEKFTTLDNAITKVWKESHYVGYNELPKGASRKQLLADLGKYDYYNFGDKGRHLDIH